MEDARSRVIAMLKEYTGKLRKIAQLKIELEHPARIGEKELIESLALGSRAPGENGSQSGHISNKTMMIALQYQDTVRQMNSDTVLQIAQELRALEAETAKFDKYLSLLRKEQGDILRLYYIEGHTWTELEDILRLSRQTMFKYRDDGITELASMYQFIEQVKNAPSDNI